MLLLGPATNGSHQKNEFVSLTKCGKQRHNSACSSQLKLIDKILFMFKDSSKMSLGAILSQPLITNHCLILSSLQGFQEDSGWCMDDGND